MEPEPQGAETIGWIRSRNKVSAASLDQTQDPLHKFVFTMRALNAVFRICIRFVRIRIQPRNLNADPDSESTLPMTKFQ